MASPGDAAAYAAFRLPATFAALHAALKQTAALLPGWQPETLLDVGAGPGTAMWAARAVWPSISRVSLIERDTHMIALGRRLAAESSAAPLRDAHWRQADILEATDLGRHDLVIASYVIGELKRQRIPALVERLWAATAGTLVLLEPGTTPGFAQVRELREQLIALGGSLVAPCPHVGTCPMSGTDWCHFAARLSRSRLHRQVKSGDLSYEDEKYSFVSFSRLPGAGIPGRVVRHPLIRSGHVHLRLCTPDGLSDRIVSRRHGDVFRRARDLAWGDAWDPHAGQDGEP